MDTLSVIKKLPESFPGKRDMKGTIYTLLCRTDNIAMYKLMYECGTVKYEVIKIKLYPRMDWSSGKRSIIKGEFTEAYPPSEAFGLNSIAWSFSDQLKATMKYQSLNM